jgi:3(or 17)beta-hydroxysteroid dehydrogenase
MTQEAGKFAGKVAVVTGGASGIGHGAAAQLSAMGCQVILTDIAGEQGQEIADRIGAHFLIQDVASEASWRSVIGTIEERYGRLDILVNNAGIYAAGNIETTDLLSWNRLQEVNAGSVFLGCKYGIGLMKRTGGSIINVSSGAALRPTSSAAAYSASKSAVWNLTRTTALYCAEQAYGIRCNSIHPGLVETPMVAERAGDESERQELYGKYAAMHPVGRMARISDVVAAIIFLASDEAEYLTGVALPVDGGYAIG